MYICMYTCIVAFLAVQKAQFYYCCSVEVSVSCNHVDIILSENVGDCLKYLK